MTGFTKVDNEILEAIQHYKFNLNELKIVMCIWRYTYGFNRDDHAMSLSFFENHTGLSRGRLNKSLKDLAENNVILITEKGNSKRSNSYSFNKNYSDWKNGKYNTFSSVQNDTSSQDGTSVQDDTATSVRNGTATSSQDGTRGSVRNDTQERKVKEIYKERGKEREPQSPASTNVSLCFQFYESNVGILSPIHREEMLHYFDDFNGDGEVLIEAMKIACDRSKKNFGFVKWLLNQWLNANAKTIDAVKAYEVSKFNSSQSYQKGQSVQRVSQRPTHWKEPEPLTEQERKEMAELEAQMPY
jgi:phage replication O-like protein O